MSPNNPATASNNLLLAELTGRIRGHGPVSLSGYIARCLNDPHLGYYTRGLNFLDEAGQEAPLGRDFTTAPCLTPLFGATLAHWVHQGWQRLGQPASLHLVEAGPGNATLMLPLLLQLNETFPALAAGLHVHLVESSPALTALQRRKLTAAALTPPVTWHTSLATLPTSAPTLLIANELLDALPYTQHTFTENQWYQNFVALDESENLAFGRKPARHVPALPPQWQAPNNAASWQPAEGTLLESSPAQQHWLHELRTHLQRTGGAALLIDYGYTTLPPQGGSTLQALYRHQPVSPLHHPGLADITAHVNFPWVAQALGHTPETPCCTITELAPFLLRHGLLTLAESSIHTPATQSALHRLLHPTQMASLFNVLEFTA